MSEIAHWSSLATGWVATPIFAIAGITLHLLYQRTPTLVLAVGLVITAIGQLVQLFSPFTDMSFQDAQGIITAHGAFPVSWYLGSVIFSAGLAVACIGFVWLSFTARQAEK